MISAQGLTKSYGSVPAVDSIDFQVQPGHVTGFLGPNGAGKSTTMRMLLGLDRPSRGGATINGHRYLDSPAPLREVGALLDAGSAHPGRSARDHLRWLAASNGIAPSRVDDVLDQVGLTGVANQRVGKFSLGMCQRLGIASALIGDPPVVILDEPVNGLDPEGIRWVRTLAKRLADDGRTVFLSSHLMSEMALTADHLIVIGRGTILADCTMSDFIAEHATSYVKLSTPELDTVAKLLTHHHYQVVRHDDVLHVHNADTARVGDLLAGNYTVHELTLVRSSLEDAFMTLTADSVEYHAHGVSA